MLFTVDAANRALIAIAVAIAFIKLVEGVGTGGGKCEEAQVIL